MSLPLSFFALFTAVALLQLGSGSITPLDALGGLSSGFSTTEIGLLGSAHFVGFFVGCWVAPRWMGAVGHARTFAVFAAAGVIGAIAHPLWIGPLPWALMRVLNGLCVAGCYTVVEAWMNAEVSNRDRGRALGSYRLVDLSASMLAQTMIAFLPPAQWQSYNLIAIVFCTALLPLSLTRARQPTVVRAPRLRPLTAFALSPLGVIGVAVAGVSTASFRMVGPVYGSEVGLAAGQIGFFLAAFVLGGALAQLPVGWMADRFDRRWVLIALSLLAVLASWGTVAFGTRSAEAVFAAALLFGAASFPVFSVASAHANDFAGDDTVVELSAALLFWYGLGAIASPLLVSGLIEHFGPPALFGFIAIAHLLLAAAGLRRMLVRPSAAARTPYRYIPRTSFVLGRLWRRRGDG